MADGPAREAIPTSIDQGLLLGERERLSCGETSNAWTKNIISRKIESDIADPPLPGRIIPSMLMYRLVVVIPGGRALILSRHPEARSLGRRTASRYGNGRRNARKMDIAIAEKNPPPFTK